MKADKDDEIRWLKKISCQRRTIQSIHTGYIARNHRENLVVYPLRKKMNRDVNNFLPATGPDLDNCLY